ncbi:MAG TPA: CAAD domain-containing protein [Candidatus Caenarcaniphilales bacterium]
MDPEVKQAESLEVTSAQGSEAGEAATALDTSPVSVAQPQDAGSLAVTSTDSSNLATDQNWQESKDQLYWLLSVLPERVGEVHEEYKKPITTVAIALAAIPFVVLTVALLQMINAIPLFAPTFKLIGFGYASWFVYRYLLFAERRQELSQEYQSLKGKILGQKS